MEEYTDKQSKIQRGSETAVSVDILLEMEKNEKEQFDLTYNKSSNL